MEQTAIFFLEEADSGQTWWLIEHNREKNPCQTLCSVYGGLIDHSKAPDGGGAKRREHGWPPLYQSDDSSSTQTKLTCRCTGHVHALCGNKSHWIRGRYPSPPLNTPCLPGLSLDEGICLSAWLATLLTTDWTLEWTAHEDHYGKRLFFKRAMGFTSFNLPGWLSIGWAAAVKTSYSRTEEVKDTCKVVVLKSNYDLLSLNNSKWAEICLAVNMSLRQCWCDSLPDIHPIW